MGENKVSAHERALRLLAQRQHFRADLRRKLLARGYEPAEVDEALARCQAQGYLDDEATAKAFVSERQERRGLGRSRIAAELRRHGASGAAVAAALGGVTEEGELARAREAAARWSRRAGRRGVATEEPDAAARREELATLARHLDRKGFSRRAIVAALAGGGDDEGVELAEADPPAAD